VGGDVSINAKMVKDVLMGKNGARRKIILLNAALIIVAGQKAATLREGIAIAEQCIDSGGALEKLQALIELSNS
jgi:anthranilate phosphoribosyltransferase